MEINYNIVLYIGIALMIGGFILFLIAQHFERQADIRLIRQQQLDKAFRKAKNDNTDNIKI